nr:copper chaperone [uncultured Dyadobacter sp.]
MRSVYSLSFSVVVTLLHIGCCVLPLASVASLSVVNVGFWAEHQMIFQILQYGMALWFTGRLLAFYIFDKNFHSRTELISYCFGWLIAATGILINYNEPFKSENQILAEQHFERFRNLRQLTIRLGVPFDAGMLRDDLRRIDGVRKGSVSIETGAITLSYHKHMVTPDQIYEALRTKGYVVGNATLPEK